MFSFTLQQTHPIPLNIELSIARGELHALVGPSGSGKTTCLRALAGLVKIEQSQIASGDEIWTNSAQAIDRPPHQRRVGLVFQSYALFPHMTARANVMAALGHLKAPERSPRADQWLNRVKLKGLEERLPHELSGGQQQRVAMARALAREPAALLLDEPFAAVDQRTRQRLYRELALLRSELAMPILLVTHDLNEARMLADRMTVLYRGQALATDTPEQLIAHPPSSTVARLMGERNLFQGQLSSPTHLRWGDLTLEVKGDHAFASGDPVTWMIQPSSVLLHRRDRPSNGERENPLTGHITEALPLGEQLFCLMTTSHGQEIAFALSRHAARRNNVAKDRAVTVSLLADGIHLMPAD